MTRVESVSRPHDRCDTCSSSRVEPQPGADNLLCMHPAVLAAFGRRRVASGLARAEVCRGRYHPRYR